MRERTVTNIVHKDGGLYGFGLGVEDKLSLLLQREDGFAHQMEGAQRMLEARVTGSWIDHGCQS